jgi:hypothetical protein
MLKAKAFHIFIIAEQFRYAGKLATIIPMSDHKFAHFLPNLPTAAMVCSAFSLELYFKCLIRMSRKSFGREHDLTKLFSLIGRRNQAKIKKYWQDHSATVRADVQTMYKDSPLPTPEVDFKFCLAASKDAFVQMRYVYERGIESGRGWLGDTIVEGARGTILDKHPKWESARQTSPMPITSLE